MQGLPEAEMEACQHGVAAAKWQESLREWAEDLEEVGVRAAEDLEAEPASSG